jgi:thiol:disulfide interchange protein DsbD
VVGVALVGLLTIGLTTDRAASTPSAPGREARPVVSVTHRLRWTDFASGMAEARESGRPVLATFVTSWCPYCGKMDKQTWRSPAVIERLEGTILVKVDAEDRAANGPELAREYGVSGYPVQLLLAPDGRVLARAGGYQSPGQLVSWLDSALDRAAFRNPAAATPSALR